MASHKTPLLALTLVLSSYLCSAVAVAQGETQQARTLEAHLVARLQLMKSVAAWKWVNAVPIEDLDREQLVIDRAVLAGLPYGLKKHTVESFYRAQIAAAKDIQRYWFDQWRVGSPPHSAPDLNAEIRPQLLELGDLIIENWGARPELTSPEMLEATLSRVEGLPFSARQILIDSLISREFYTDPLAQIQDSGVLRIGTTGDYRPFSYEDETGTLQGVDIALGRALADHLQVAPVFVATSWPTLMDDYATNLFDIAISGVSITEARQSVAAFSMPYFFGGKGAIARCEDAARFQSLENIDQPNVRVIVNPGGTNEQFVAANIHQATVISHQDNRTIFQRIIVDDADVMVTDLVEVQLQSLENSALCPAIEQPLNQQNKGILIQRSEALASRINNWLVSEKTQALIDHLFGTYGIARTDR